MARQPRATRKATKATANANAQEANDVKDTQETTAPETNAKPAFAESIEAAKEKTAQHVVAVATPKLNSALEKYADPESGKIEVDVFRMEDGKSIVAAFQADENSDLLWSWNDAKKSHFYASLTPAVKNVLTQLDGIKAADIADVSGDLANYKEGAELETPWETDAELDALGKSAGEIVSGIIGSQKKQREDYISLGTALAAARAKCDASSKTGTASTATWSAYKIKYFPDIETLGKNTANEAVYLGSAPQTVLDVWPTSQTSAKAFQSWVAQQKRFALGVVVKHFQDANRAALEAWRDDAESTISNKPALPDHKAVREYMVTSWSDDLLAMGAAFAKKALEPDAEGKRLTDKAHAELIALADDAKAQKRVVDWTIERGDVPAIDPAGVTGKGVKDENGKELPVCPFRTSKLYVDVMDALRDFWAGFISAEQETKENAKAVEAQVSGISKTFAEMDVTDAALHLSKILLAHDDAQDVYASLGNMLTAALEKRALEAEAAANDADAELDGQAD